MQGMIKPKDSERRVAIWEWKYLSSAFYNESNSFVSGN